MVEAEIGLHLRRPARLAHDLEMGEETDQEPHHPYRLDRPAFRSGPERILPRPGEDCVPLLGRAEPLLHQPAEHLRPPRLALWLPSESPLEPDPRQDLGGDVEREVRVLGTSEERSDLGEGGKDMGSYPSQVVARLQRPEPQDLQSDGPPGAEEQAEGIEEVGGGRDFTSTEEDEIALVGAEGLAVEGGEEGVGEPERVGVGRELGAEEGRREGVAILVEVEL
jgi:hypothetical protein